MCGVQHYQPHMAWSTHVFQLEMHTQDRGQLIMLYAYSSLNNKSITHIGKNKHKRYAVSKDIPFSGHLTGQKYFAKAIFLPMLYTKVYSHGWKPGTRRLSNLGKVLNLLKRKRTEHQTGRTCTENFSRKAEFKFYHYLAVCF